MTEPTTNQDELVDGDETGAEGTEAASEASDRASADASGSRDVDGSEGPGGAGEPRETDDSDEEDVPSGAEASAHAEARSESDSRPAKNEVRPDDTGRTEVVALREEFEALNDRHLRLVAEFNNFRRRSEQERMSAWTRAQADLVAKLLDVLDDLQRVADLDLSNATVEAIMEGIDLVERKFLRQLNEAGIEVLEPEGDVFDPERMEAMMRVPADEEDQVDTVAQVFQKGYSLKGTLVRPARVSVYTQ